MKKILFIGLFLILNQFSGPVWSRLICNATPRTGFETHQGIYRLEKEEEKTSWWSRKTITRYTLLAPDGKAVWSRTIAEFDSIWSPDQEIYILGVYPANTELILVYGLAYPTVDTQGARIILEIIKYPKLTGLRSDLMFTDYNALAIAILKVSFIDNPDDLPDIVLTIGSSRFDPRDIVIKLEQTERGIEHNPKIKISYRDENFQRYLY